MTSRPPYVPQLLQARWGMCWAPHWLQAVVIGAVTFHCALRRRVRERDIFFFGTAMGPRFGSQSPGGSRRSRRTEKGDPSSTSETS
jgi:hypothetical protein